MVIIKEQWDVCICDIERMIRAFEREISDMKGDALFSSDWNEIVLMKLDLDRCLARMIKMRGNAAGTADTLEVSSE